ncbi:hypothetical protein ABZ851_11350 [Streptomyces sp. NPDC047049]|uniref:hypothetical protein n=1 Tax=Streptomyces sp. NPDC047049 TaxID=3156688 RepID=UPI0033CDFFE0
MHHVRRSATLTLLLLLAVTFGPLLCRIGGDQAWLAGRAAAATAAWRADAATPASPAAARTAASPADADASADEDGPAYGGAPADGDAPAYGPADGDAPTRPSAATAGGPRLDPGAPLAVAHAPKKCSNRHAPGPAESAPLPTPHRGEPLAPATTGVGPLAADLPAQYALARPPTDSAPARDRTPLLPVLRI